MKKNIIITLVLLVVFTVIGFFAGTKYQQHKITSQFNQRLGANGAPNAMNRGSGNRSQANGFRQTIGEIISVDDKSVTVKMSDGSSRIILISDSTILSQSTSATRDDLKIGVQVAVSGDQNTDGSVTAKNIQLNPQIPTPTITK